MEPAVLRGELGGQPVVGWAAQAAMGVRRGGGLVLVPPPPLAPPGGQGCRASLPPAGSVPPLPTDFPSRQLTQPAHSTPSPPPLQARSA